jgi:hypothetical protein
MTGCASGQPTLAPKSSLSLGDEAYKSRYASETREVFKVHLFGSGMTPRLKRVALSLQETAKQNPRLYGAVKRVLSRG